MLDFYLNAAEAPTMVNPIVSIVMLFSYMATLAFMVIIYVIYSIGHMRALRAVGYSKPWLAWIPYANAKVMGDLADKYDNGKPSKNLGKKLLGWMIAESVVVSVCYGVILFAAVLIGMRPSVGIALLGTALMLIACLAMLGVLIPYIIYFYIAYWNILRIFAHTASIGLLMLGIFVVYAIPFVIFSVSKNKPQNLRGEISDEENGGDNGPTYGHYSGYVYNAEND